MRDRAREEAGIVFLEPNEIDLRGVCGEQDVKDPAQIGLEDITFNPKPDGPIHIKEFSERTRTKAAWTVAPRKLMVIQNNKESPDDIPTIHPAVIERNKADQSYRADSLKGARHRVYRREPEEIFPGLEAHV